MYRKLFIIAAVVAILPAMLFFACHPERTYMEDSDARLEFTLDTLFFDTVFTTIGTVTKSFRIKNPHRDFVKIQEVNLAGGGSSVFRMNVDGVPGTSFSGLEIAPGDSMYVFVEATLEPNNSSDVLRIQDSIVFLTNGNTQDIDLVAWGQDVHILNEEELSGTVTWTAEKPYLILGFAYVDSVSSLTIEAGTRIYLHRNALIFVDGTLHVEGSREEPVLFAGDRLEEFYQDIPGQWGLIYLSELSRDNRIDYAEIRNGTIGVLISAPPESGRQPDLEISNTVINYMSSNGIYALNARVEGSNLVVGQCGGSSAGLIYGGSYRFVHCTFFNDFPGYFNRQLPAVLLTDYFGNYDEQGNLEVFKGGVFERAEFLNSIIYGSSRIELAIDSYDGLQLNYFFDHCMIKVDEDSLDFSSDPQFGMIINNEIPLFDTVLASSFPVEFLPDSLSPAVNAGLAEYAIGVPFDLDGINRLDDEAPDLGALERVMGGGSQERR